MAYRIVISDSELIDWIEENRGGVYEAIKESDHIEEISLLRGSYDIEIIIGDR